MRNKAPADATFPSGQKRSELLVCTGEGVPAVTHPVAGVAPEAAEDALTQRSRAAGGEGLIRSRGAGAEVADSGAHRGAVASAGAAGAAPEAEETLAGEEEAEAEGGFRQNVLLPPRAACAA